VDGEPGSIRQVVITRLLVLYERRIYICRTVFWAVRGKQQSICKILLPRTTGHFTLPVFQDEAINHRDVMGTSLSGNDTNQAHL
jgi:hypothetical protein